MDFTLPPDAIDLRDLLRQFIEKDVRPLEMAFFTKGVLEQDARERLKTAVEQMGLWGVTLPEKVGGFGLDLVSICIIDEELAKTFLPVDLGEVCPILYACEGEQCAAFLEPVLAGDRKALLAAREPTGLFPGEWTTAAQPVEDGYILNGAKLLPHAPGPGDFLVVFAHAPEGLTAFLVDLERPGLCLTMGDPVRVDFEDCRVSAADVLGAPGSALTLEPDEAIRAWVRDGARTVGMAARLLEMAAAYAADWESFGEPLSVRPAVRRALSELRTRIECVRWLVVHAAWSADEGRDLRTPAAQVRIAAADLHREAVDLVTMVHGGPGPSTPEITRARLARGTVPWEAREHSLAAAAAVLMEN